MLKLISICLFLFLFKFFSVKSHGRLMDPPARSSCWREFGNKCKTDYSDMQRFCGGFSIQWFQNGQTIKFFLIFAKINPKVFNSRWQMWYLW